VASETITPNSLRQNIMVNKPPSSSISSLYSFAFGQFEELSLENQTEIWQVVPRDGIELPTPGFSVRPGLDFFSSPAILQTGCALLVPGGGGEVDEKSRRLFRLDFIRPFSPLLKKRAAATKPRPKKKVRVARGA
jgi:hypothetical protein